MRNQSKVYIDPFCRVSYASFYIKGLYSVFGKSNVSFSDSYFKDLEREKGANSFDFYMAFVVVDPNGTVTKIIIDYHDGGFIKENAYKWADKYAKININEELTGKEYYDKLISIPPGFGIKIWNLWETGYNACLNYIRCKLSPIVSPKVFFIDYYHQYKRSRLEKYVNNSDTATQEAERLKPYVFMIGTLWGHKNCLEGTNLQRKNFFEACQKSNCELEGGFFGTANHPQYQDFKDMIFLKRYRLKNYIEKTKLSAFVFNTPSVHNCHGWKLGEYLASGKAIISTPLSNELPGSLNHGESIHIISNDDEMGSAINLLLENSNYRASLEKGARQYYKQYANPRSVVENMVKNTVKEKSKFRLGLNYNNIQTA